MAKLPLFQPPARAQQLANQNETFSLLDQSLAGIILG